MFDVPFCEFDKNFKFETIDEKYKKIKNKEKYFVFEYNLLFFIDKLYPRIQFFLNRIKRIIFIFILNIIKDK